MFTTTPHRINQNKPGYRRVIQGRVTKKIIRYIALGALALGAGLYAYRRHQEAVLQHKEVILEKAKEAQAMVYKYFHTSVLYTPTYHWRHHYTILRKNPSSKHSEMTDTITNFARGWRHCTLNQVKVTHYRPREAWRGQPVQSIMTPFNIPRCQSREDVCASALPPHLISACAQISARP